MDSHRVEKIKYEDLYEFVMYSDNTEDYVERLKVMSSIIVLELSDRIIEADINVAFQVVPIIDKMNEEIITLVDNINKTEIIENQIPIEQPLLLRLIQVNNARLYNDYQYIKNVLVN